MKFKNSSSNSAMPVPSALFADDAARLRVLESFEPDALEDDPELAAIVKFAARLCDVPVSQVTLVEDERQRFLVREGIEERETPREMAFCEHALGAAELVEVRDAAADPRFAENPLVTGWPEVRFYAGQPLVSEEGAPLGTLCVIDLQVRPDGLNDFQREGMAVLAQAVMRRLNARREKLAASRELGSSAARFLALANAMPDIAWSSSADGTVQYLNSRWYDFTGQTDTGTVEDSTTLIHPDDQPSVFASWAEARAQGKPWEAQCRIRYRDGGYRWVISRCLPAHNDAGELIGWFGTSTDIDDFHRLSESRDLLSRELAHRIKNIFAVVIGLAMLKARAAPEHLPFAEDLASALRALGSAHEFTRVAGGAVEENLHALLAAMFRPYADPAGGERVRVAGADFSIAVRAATPLALIFHELATNAAKYGALSAASGHVDLVIEDRGEALVITWREQGGPPVNDQGMRGFGSRLVEMAVTGQLQGQWQREFAPDGLQVVLTIPKTAVAD